MCLFSVIICALTGQIEVTLLRWRMVTTTLVRPTWKNLVLDPLTVHHLDNWLWMNTSYFVDILTVFIMQHESQTNNCSPLKWYLPVLFECSYYPTQKKYFFLQNLKTHKQIKGEHYKCTYSLSFKILPPGFFSCFLSLFFCRPHTTI